MNANILLSMFSFFKVLCILGLVVAELAADQILQFPREAVGVVWTGHWPAIDGPKLLFANDALQAQRAQGMVAVDDDLFVTLELSQPASQDLSFLRQLPADGIHSLTIRNADLDAVKMECIAGLKTLR